MLTAACCWTGIFAVELEDVRFPRLEHAGGFMRNNCCAELAWGWAVRKGKRYFHHADEQTFATALYCGYMPHCVAGLSGRRRYAGLLEAYPMSR